MSDECEPEVDVMGDYNVDIGSMSNPLEISDLQSSATEINTDLALNLWSLEQSQNWYLDQTIDEKSRMTIEKMLQEEKNFIGVTPEVHRYQTKTERSEKKIASSPTHKKPWTQSEKDLFIKGLELYGRKWTQISRHVGTRTTLQVKNFARQYLKNQDKLSSFTSQQINNPILHESISEVLSAVTTGEVSSVFADPSLDNDEQKGTCNLEPVSYVVAEEIVHISSQKSGSDNEEDIDICEDGEIDFSNGSLHSSDIKSEILHDNLDLTKENILIINDALEAPTTSKSILESSNEPDNDDETKFGTFHFVSTENDDQKETFLEIKSDLKLDNIESQTDQDYSLHDSNVDVDINSVLMLNEENEVMLNAPSEEMDIEDNFISEEERKIHKEFFEGRHQKTPERYLRIRSYIIDSWKKSKPNYLNKTSVRPGLKNCGDVNCIGRIHQYLEQVGAINFGCEQARYNRPQPVNTTGSFKERLTNEELLMLHSVRMESMRPRKRKQPAFLDSFSLDEGYTMAHDVDGAVVETVHSIAAPKSKQSKSKAPNPFKLVRCVKFSEKQQEPYSLEVSVEAVMIADIHCHSVHTEVMGLLGGKYDSGNKVLQVLTCEACESLSTGVQCEMDPVSQTMGMEALQNAGYQVVGWYHSHPTFVPDPSYRDIETQVRYQELFENQGHNPFIAMIISPFCQTTNTSIIKYLIVEHDERNDSIQTPFSFSEKLIENNIDVGKILAKAERFFTQSSQSGFQVEMMSVMARSPDVTYLDVMLNSLEQKLEKAKLDQEIIKDILLGINKLVLQNHSDAK